MTDEDEDFSVAENIQSILQDDRIGVSVVCMRLANNLIQNYLSQLSSKKKPVPMELDIASKLLNKIDRDMGVTSDLIRDSVNVLHMTYDEGLKKLYPE